MRQERTEREMQGTRVGGLLVVVIAALCGMGYAQTPNRVARFDSNGTAVNSTIVDNGGDGSVERVRVDASGNVGIGTTTPGNRLQVEGFGSANGIGLGANGNVANNIAGDIYVTNEGNGNLHLGVSRSSVGWGNLVLGENGGNVGIGTSTPTELLQLGDGVVVHSGGHKVIGFGWSPSSNRVIMNSIPAEIRWNPSSGVLSLGVDSTTRSVGQVQAISNLINLVGGNVGIGTTSPDTALTVRTNANTTGFKWAGSYTVTNNSDGSQYTRLLVGQNATNNFILDVNNQVDAKGNMLMMPWGGNVGIGTTTPSAKLEVAGNVKLSSGGAFVFSDGTTQTTAWTGVLCGGDYAESVDVSEKKAAYEPGDVLVIDKKNPGHFTKAAEPYSRLVAGIYSTKPGVVGLRSTDAEKAKDEIPMAMVGIVPTKVSAENGPIEPGDLLVTSSLPGYAMKATDFTRATGAMVGKALTALDSGNGVIDVLVSLR
jgi:hypothetical protein